MRGVGFAWVAAGMMTFGYIWETAPDFRDHVKSEDAVFATFVAVTVFWPAFVGVMLGARRDAP
jgi:hypothetical protein